MHTDQHHRQTSFVVFFGPRAAEYVIPLPFCLVGSGRPVSGSRAYQHVYSMFSYLMFRIGLQLDETAASLLHSVHLHCGVSERRFLATPKLGSISGSPHC